MYIVPDALKSISEITLVIPVKDNQPGIDSFLNTFFQTHGEEQLPNEIIIVDNNSNPAVTLPGNLPVPVRLARCSKAGPASARNLGASLARTNWICFTDSDCIPTPTLLTGYLSAQDGSLGYAGNVKAYRDGKYSRYYESQEILVPPKTYENSSIAKPDYLITANCLVWKAAFEAVGGFNESITIAGGEDIDLGFKLQSLGELAYAFDSIVKHNFEEDMKSFRERFRRYGRGNRIVSELYDLDLTPSPFVPNQHRIFNYFLALIQFLALRRGYRQ